MNTPTAAQQPVKQHKPITHIVRSYTAAGERRYTQHSGIDSAITERQHRRDNLCDFQIEIVEVLPVEIELPSRGPVIGYRPAVATPVKRPAQHRKAVPA